MPIEIKQLQKLFQDAQLPFVPYAYIDDQMILQDKKADTYYFRKSTEENYEAGEENITLVVKENAQEFKKFSLKVEMKAEKLIFLFPHQHDQKNQQVDLSIREQCELVFDCVLDEPIFPENLFSKTDLLKFQSEIKKPLDILRSIFKAHPSEQFSYEAKDLTPGEKYTLWKSKAPSEKDSYFFLLEHKSGKEFHATCRYQFTLIGSDEVEVSKFIYKKRLMWSRGRDSLPHKTLVRILENLAGIAKEQTKSLFDSVKDGVSSNCSVM